uniref:Uncharacterized protein MANES_06G040200 n=1 Tax=Rhizophora mucronata TaxID=61149 RepID=A0A2P2MWS1_RHIMU
MLEHDHISSCLKCLGRLNSYLNDLATEVVLKGNY